MGKRIDRIGEINTNNQGLKMKIINYTSATHIDIEFLVDGLILYKRAYKEFSKGSVKHPKYNDIRKMENRVGETSYNTKGVKMTIIKYRNNNDIDIQFGDGSVVYHQRYSHFLNGQIRYKNIQSFCDMGYMGQGCYNHKTTCHGVNILSLWQTLIRRCSYKEHKRGRSLCNSNDIDDRFKNFQFFAQWYIDNSYVIENEKMCIDKDWIKKGNRLYSPETCLIVPEYINLLINDPKNSRGIYPIGVSYNKNAGKFRSKMSEKEKEVHLGYYSTVEDAFNKYKIAKEAYIKKIADEYKNKYPQFPQKIYDAMYAYLVEFDD